MNPIEQSRAERNLVGGAFEGLFGLEAGERGLTGSFGRGFSSTVRFGALGAWHAAKFGVSGLAMGAGYAAQGVWGMVPGSATWRDRRARTVLNRKIADGGSGALEKNLAAEYEKLTGETLTANRRAQIVKEYGYAGGRLRTGFGGARPFAQRGVRGHLLQGTKTYLRHGLFSPLSWGINLGFSLHDSGGNLLDPETGVAKHMIGFMGMEAGFMIGGTVGAATASALVPTGGALVAGLGYATGAIAGSLAVGYAATEGFGAMAKFGHKYGRYRKPQRTKFLDSESAMTMRQRALQAVHRSQTNARSAFGHEAMAYHA